MTYIAGRPWRQFTVEIIDSGGSVTIRFGDPADPEFWLELTLTEEHLNPFMSAFFRAKIAEQAGVDPGEVEIVGSIEEIKLKARPVGPDGRFPDPSRN